MLLLLLFEHGSCNCNTMTLLATPTATTSLVRLVSMLHAKRHTALVFHATAATPATTRKTATTTTSNNNNHEQHAHPSLLLRC